MPYLVLLKSHITNVHKMVHDISSKLYSVCVVHFCVPPFFTKVIPVPLIKD